MKNNLISILSSFIFLNVFGQITFINFLEASPNNFDKNNNLSIKYIESREELEDYILDTGDALYIDFKNAKELSETIIIDEQGELFLPRIKDTYVRGLTQSDLRRLLIQKYSEFMINPEIIIKIVGFRSVKVNVNGEVRSPGKYSSLPYYAPLEFIREDKVSDSLPLENVKDINNFSNSFLTKNELFKDFYSDIPDNQKEKITTITSSIKNSGGLTSFSDISKIEIIRDIPLSKGGGKKKAIFDLTNYLENPNYFNDLRLFDGDKITIPKLKYENKQFLAKSINVGISPKFIEINVYGNIVNPGKINMPQGSTLSDVISISGPLKPLSGKIFLIRYLNDGSLIRKSIRFSENAKKGSKNNPFLQAGDYVSVRNSAFGRSAGFIRAVTEPFFGIYATKELIEDLNE